MKKLAYAAAVALGAVLIAASAQAATSYAVSIVDIGTAAQNGYVSRTLNIQGQFAQTADAGQALQVLEPSGPASNVLLSNVQGTSRSFLGAVTPSEIVRLAIAPGTGQAAASTSGTLSDIGSEAAALAATDSTSSGATPAFLPNSITDTTGEPLLGEASIWSLGSDGRLLPQWVNPDGSKPATSIILTEEGDLLLTGNPNLFTSRLGAREVQLVLDVPEPATLALLATGLAAAGLIRRR